MMPSEPHVHERGPSSPYTNAVTCKYVGLPHVGVCPYLPREWALYEEGLTQGHTEALAELRAKGVSFAAMENNWLHGDFAVAGWVFLEGGDGVSEALGMEPGKSYVLVAIPEEA
jgi:hypothetical protein